MSSLKPSGLGALSRLDRIRHERDDLKAEAKELQRELKLCVGALDKAAGCIQHDAGCATGRRPTDECDCPAGEVESAIKKALEEAGR